MQKFADGEDLGDVTPLEQFLHDMVGTKETDSVEVKRAALNKAFGVTSEATIDSSEREESMSKSSLNHHRISYTPHRVKIDGKEHQLTGKVHGVSMKKGTKGWETSSYLSFCKDGQVQAGIMDPPSPILFGVAVSIAFDDDGNEIFKVGQVQRLGWINEDATGIEIYFKREEVYVDVDARLKELDSNPK